MNPDTALSRTSVMSVWWQGVARAVALAISTAAGVSVTGVALSAIGSLATGKQADLVLVKGDPSTNILDGENVELVFKDGVGYDSKKLIESVTGLVGIR